MRKIYQLILASVSKENLIPMITSVEDDETTLLKAVRSDYVDLVEYIFNNVFDDNDQLRGLISSTIAHHGFPSQEPNQASGMVLQKASDLGKEEFIKLLRRPTEEITSTINPEFLKANDPIEILRFVGSPCDSFEKLDPECKSNVIDGEVAYSSFDKFSKGDSETFKEIHKKASDVFKHVFNLLEQNQKQEVILDNDFYLFYSAAQNGSYPQVSFLIEEAEKLGQEILQPMISARNYQCFHGAIDDIYTSEYCEEMRKIYQLILASVSKENLIPMITSVEDGKTKLLQAVRNDHVDLVEYIFNNVPENQLRDVISYTINYNHFPSYESKQAFGMVLQKASDLGIDVQQFLLQHKDFFLDNTTRPAFAKAFKKYASEETLEATFSSFLESEESKDKFLIEAIRRNEELEPVVNSLILSPQIQPNLNYLSRNVGLVKISYGEHKRLAKSSRYLLAVVLDLKNDSNIRGFANNVFSVLFQERKIQILEEEIIPIDYSVNINSEYIKLSIRRLLDLYTKNPRLLLENDLNQTKIDRLQELRNELIKNFSQKYSNRDSQSDLTAETAEEKAKLAEEKAKLAEKKANLTIKGLLENDGLKKFKNLANNVFLGLSDEFTEGVIKEFSSCNSEITLKGLDSSERKVALEVIAAFFEKKSRDVILRTREGNQNNSSKNSNKDSGVKAAEPEIETESVASEEVNFTSKVPANEESKPSPQIENPESSNLKRIPQKQGSSSKNLNEPNNKKPRIR
jgi:hypothetical protein